ncbi:MAG: secondary thiamine-phosphate synthase enzyme YjbQ [Acidobacteriota bacterium]|jgi:secondary thiamine-phosphate synthase enzyme
MTVRTYHREIDMQGEGDVRDLTGEISRCLSDSGIRAGVATVFVPGSTGGVTTIEFEPGVVQDLRDCFERIAPRGLEYAHEQAWHDGNGHSHVRAGLLGPSLTVPVEDGAAVLGTWQQVVLVDFDNRRRRRRWTLTVMGE